MPRLSKDERRYLLASARRAILARLHGSDLDPEEMEFEASSENLWQPCGAFVTLDRGGELRGCVGFVEPRQPLLRTVVEAAVAAATRDPRFPPVTLDELDGLAIELSVLSKAAPINFADIPASIVIGVHGLIVSRGSVRGLLLPRVAVEHGWDAERFLQETSLKAGLPATAWKEGASVSSFTAEVFSDAAPRAA